MIIAPTTTHTTQSMALSCPRSDLRSSQEPDVATEVREAFRRRACLLKIGLGAGIAIVFLVFPLSQASRHRSPTNALPARSPIEMRRLIHGTGWHFGGFSGRRKAAPTWKSWRR